VSLKSSALGSRSAPADAGLFALPPIIADVTESLLDISKNGSKIPRYGKLGFRNVLNMLSDDAFLGGGLTTSRVTQSSGVTPTPGPAYAFASTAIADRPADTAAKKGASKVKARVSLSYFPRKSRPGRLESSCSGRPLYAVIAAAIATSALSAANASAVQVQSIRSS